VIFCRRSVAVVCSALALSMAGSSVPVNGSIMARASRNFSSAARNCPNAANLHLTVHSLTEAQWLVFARSERRPPMPWFNLRDMSDRDLVDIYRYIRSLGPAGTMAPAPVAPGGKASTPLIDFVPHN